MVTIWISVLAFFLGCGALLLVEHVGFRHEASTNIQTLAKLTAANCAAGVASQNRSEVEGSLGALGNLEHLVVVGVYLADGTPFAGYSPGGATSPMPTEPSPDGMRLEKGVLFLFHPVLTGDKRVGTLYVAYDYAGHLWRARRHYLGLGILVLAAWTAIAVLFAFHLRRLVTAPLAGLAATASAITERQDYTVRAARSSQAELNTLIDAFNQMVDRVEEQAKALKRANEQLEERVRDRTHGLQELQRQLELVLDAAGEGIYGLDLSGRIVFVNLAAAKLLGWLPIEMVGQSAHELTKHSGLDTGVYPPDACPICAMSAEGQRMVDQRFARKDGSWFPVEFVSTPLIEAGARTGTVVVFKDITDRLALEGQLRHAHKMESVGRLAAGIAHDFGNIIAIVQGYAILLCAEDQTDAERRRASEEILNAASRARHLTRQLMAFSRKQVLRRRLIDLNQTVLDSSRLLRPLLGGDVELRLDLAADLSPVLADSGMLEQVLINLAVNSREAMPRGGKLTITTRAEVIDEACRQRNPEASPGRFICLSATDTGCGMDASTLAHIFEPFFSTKEPGGGTGLGLATAYGIIRQHQGWMEVQSQPGQGSCFRVLLPAAEGKVQTESPELLDVPDTLRGQGRILVVEDEPPLRMLAGRVLRRCGYEVHEAENGPKALVVWEDLDQRVDLLFADIVLPGGMNGNELAEKMLVSAPRMKILFTSAFSPETVGAGLNLDPEANFLPKPYTPLTLAKAVGALLIRSDRHRSARGLDAMRKHRSPAGE